MSESCSNRALGHSLVSLVPLIVLFVVLLALPTASNETVTVTATVAVAERGKAAVEGGEARAQAGMVAHPVAVDLSVCSENGDVKKCQEAVDRIDARFHQCCLILRKTNALTLCDWCLQRDKDVPKDDVGDRTSMHNHCWYTVKGKCIRLRRRKSQ